MHLTDEKYWEERDLYSGLIRLHILHHAHGRGMFGLGLIDELARQGYKLSAGTVYPLLHSMEKKGLLRSHERLEGGRIRRVYIVTPRGRKALMMAKDRVRTLFGALFQHLPKPTSRNA